MTGLDRLRLLKLKSRTAEDVPRPIPEVKVGNCVGCKFLEDGKYCAKLAGAGNAQAVGNWIMRPAGECPGKVYKKEER